MELARKKQQKLKERLDKKKIAKVDKEEGKSIALGTSKLVRDPLPSSLSKSSNPSLFSFLSFFFSFLSFPPPRTTSTRVSRWHGASALMCRLRKCTMPHSGPSSGGRLR
jgi:hypothetical protein